MLLPGTRRRFAWVHAAQVDFVTWAASFTGFAVLLVSISAAWSRHAHIFSASICRPATQQFHEL